MDMMTRSPFSPSNVKKVMRSGGGGNSTSKNADQLFPVDENSVNGTTNSIFILYHP